jgi:hypothetical protein
MVNGDLIWNVWNRWIQMMLVGAVLRLRNLHAEVKEWRGEVAGEIGYSRNSLKKQSTGWPYEGETMREAQNET